MNCLGLSVDRDSTQQVMGSSSSAAAAVEDSIQAAREAHLRWINDGTTPGIRRKKAGKGFVYVGANEKTVHDADTLIRIRKLAIPPAWTDVWISPFDNGHIQATGRDARGRKQYRYHARWRETRDANKYDRMIDFAKALPKIRAATERHLRLPGLPRERVLAAVVRVMEKTLIRVGNEEYAKQNKSYGLTTLQDKHARIRGAKVVFEFRGKSGIEHEIDFQDPRLAKIVKQCRDLPGQELFQYVDADGQVRDINSTDVNDYLHQIAGDEFTAKDFRTWAGTVLAARALQMIEPFASQKAAKKNVVRAVESVAKRLGNTVAVCRKCYIHPAVINSYLDGSLANLLSKRAGQELSRGGVPAEEAAVLGLLQASLSREARHASPPDHKTGKSRPGAARPRPGHKSAGHKPARSTRSDATLRALHRDRRGRALLRRFKQAFAGRS
jgi:DNA topoisomerase-1